MEFLLKTLAKERFDFKDCRLIVTQIVFLFFLKNLKVNFHKKSQVLWYDQSEEEKVDQRQREWEQNPHRSGNSSLPPFLLWDTAWAFRIMVQTLCPSMFKGISEVPSSFDEK